MTRELIEELKDIKIAIFDLDGVIYRGDKLIPNVDNIIQELKKLSIKIVYNSNNSTATRQMYVDRLKNFGIPCNITDFYTSASITAKEITKLKEKANVFVIGEMGLKDELRALEHIIITDELQYDKVDFVIVGLDRDFHYKKLAIAQKCILQGKAHFYATNADATLPAPIGLLPGAGVMVNAVEVCTSKKPEKVFGKPNPYGIEMILNDFRIEAKDAVIFGDRLDTDIAAGNNVGIKTVLVLTGVTPRKKVNQIEHNFLKISSVKNNLIPDIIIDTLNEIFK